MKNGHAQLVPEKKVTIFLGIVLVLAICALCYLNWRQISSFKAVQSDLTQEKQALQKDNQGLEASLTAEKSKSAALKTSNDDLQKQIEQLKNPVPKPLTASYQASRHFGKDYYFYGPDTNDFLLVNVAVKNSSSQENFLSLGSFKLKDKDNKAYPQLKDSAVGMQPRFLNGVETLPDGLVELRNQAVAGGETITGTLIFYVPQAANDFTLTYNSQAFTIKP